MNGVARDVSWLAHSKGRGLVRAPSSGTWKRPQRRRGGKITVIKITDMVPTT